MRGVIVSVLWAVVAIGATAHIQQPLPATVAVDIVLPVQTCTGHGDRSPGCPADPAPWVCTREGKGGAKACGCKQVCNSDGEQVDESVDCPRRCDKKCLCHVEEECPSGHGAAR